MKTFGCRLKEVREAKGITQKNLAEYLHLRNTTISNWENDMGEPPYETLKKFFAGILKFRQIICWVWKISLML